MDQKDQRIERLEKALKRIVDLDRNGWARHIAKDALEKDDKS